ncbi:MAG: tetratricopeptide repeat protein, partial [Candidatus Eremiobacterota bacterium]
SDRGDNLYRMEAYEEALKCYDKALKILDSDYTELWSARGDCLYELGRYEESVTCYDRALEINPDSEDIKEARKEALKGYES